MVYLARGPARRRPRRRQGAAAGDHRDLRLRPLRPGDPDPGAAAAPGDRAGARFPRVGRAALLRHAICAGRVTPRSADARGTAAARRRARASPTRWPRRSTTPTRSSVLHRDIKPANILLDGGRVVVCDFGVARAVEIAAGDTISSSGLVLGTPAYMSPEQAMGSDIDERTDVYALGCVIYEMLAGEPAFTGATSQAVVARLVSEEPRPLRGVRPDLPPSMERAIRAALAKQPEGRPGSAGELLQPGWRDLQRPTAEVASADQLQLGPPNAPAASVSGQYSRRSSDSTPPVFSSVFSHWSCHSSAW